jgi:hypothetical protein
MVLSQLLHYGAKLDLVRACHQVVLAHKLLLLMLSKQLKNQLLLCKHLLKVLSEQQQGEMHDSTVI